MHVYISEQLVSCMYASVNSLCDACMHQWTACVMHVCISEQLEWCMYVSVNSLSPVQCHAITSTNDVLLSNGPMGTNLMIYKSNCKIGDVLECYPLPWPAKTWNDLCDLDLLTYWPGNGTRHITSSWIVFVPYMNITHEIGNEPQSWQGIRDWRTELN